MRRHGSRGLRKVSPKCLSISEKRLSSDSRDEDMSGVSGGIKKVINLFATGQAAKNFADGVSDVPRRFSFTFYRSKKTPKAFSEHPREGTRREIGNGLCSSKRTHTSQPRGSRQRQLSRTGGRWSIEESVEKVVARKKAGMSGDGTGRSKEEGSDMGRGEQK